MKPYGNFRKLYEALRPYDQHRVAVLDVKDLAEIHSIWLFYESLSTDELHLLSAAIKKADAQLGYIPFCFTTVPIVFLVFSGKLSTLLAHNMIFILLLIVVFSVLGVFLIHRHFTNKAYNAVHGHIVETLLSAKTKKEKKDKTEKADEAHEPLSPSCHVHPT